MMNQIGQNIMKSMKIVKKSVNNILAINNNIFILKIRHLRKGDIVLSG